MIEQVACPNVYHQGVVRPLITKSGDTVMMCDDGGEVWLRPDDVGSVEPFVPTAPDWFVNDRISVEPGTTRWASDNEAESTG